MLVELCVERASLDRVIQAFAAWTDRVERGHRLGGSEELQLALECALPARLELRCRHDEALASVFHQDDVSFGRSLAEERPAVNQPWDPNAGGIGDRGHDVERPGRRSVNAPALLVRELDEERHVGDVLEIRLRERAPLLARAEADAVIGRDNEQRLVVEARLA